jgi:hypothetical protein
MEFPKPQDSLLEDNGETRGLSEMAMEKLYNWTIHVDFPKGAVYF